MTTSKQALGGQKLGHHQRAHGPAGLERAQHIWGHLEQLPDRQVPPLEAGLMLDDVRLLRVLVSHTGGVLGHRPTDPSGSSADMPAVGIPVLANDATVSLTVEGPNRRVIHGDLGQDGT